MGIIIDTGKPTVVRFTQGCYEDGCEKTWTVTRAAMCQVSDASWGRQRCHRHSSIHSGAGRPRKAA